MGLTEEELIDTLLCGGGATRGLELADAKLVNYPGSGGGRRRFCVRRGKCGSARRVSVGVVIVLVLSVLLGCGTKPPGDVVKEFQTLVAEGKYEAASRHVASGSREMFMMTAAMAEGLSGMFGSASIRTVEVTGESISGNTADVSYVIHFRDGTTGWEEWEHLVKEGGRWRIGIQF